MQKQVLISYQFSHEGDAITLGRGFGYNRTNTAREAEPWKTRER